LTNAASVAVALTVGGNGANTTFSGALQGAGSLTKIGGGTLLLGGSNNYIGSTAINAGTLQVVNTVALPGYATPGKIGVASSAALAVSAGGSGWTAADIGALLASNSSGFASGSFLGIDTSGGSLAYDASIAGSIALKKLGSNALVLSGSNQYSGGTMVAGGSLVLTDPEAIADGSSLTVGAAAAFLGASVSPARPYADSPAAMAAVPEPGTLALAGVAGIVAGLFKAFYLFKSRRSAVSRAR
jgi:autotransporter-associated beta strand protein